MMPHNLTNLNGVVGYQVVNASADIWVMADVERKRPSISRVSTRGYNVTKGLASFFWLGERDTNSDASP